MYLSVPVPNVQNIGWKVQDWRLGFIDICQGKFLGDSYRKKCHIWHLLSLSPNYVFKGTCTQKIFRNGIHGGGPKFLFLSFNEDVIKVFLLTVRKTQQSSGKICAPLIHSYCFCNHQRIIKTFYFFWLRFSGTMWWYELEAAGTRWRITCVATTPAGVWTKVSFQVVMPDGDTRHGSVLSSLCTMGFGAGNSHSWTHN